MRNQLNHASALLRYLALAGNALFILWILRNGINEGFNATLLEKISYVGLLLLLLLNIILIYPLARRN